MALTATIYKVALHIADMDRPYYGDHALTIARHPSETDERMMVRVLAFSRHAHESLSFGKGLSTEDEPDLWQRDLTGAIDLWIEVGQPDERSVRRACGRARQVVLYTYGGRSADLWWKNSRTTLERSKNLTVVNLPAGATSDLAALAQRDMDLQCTIQDGHIWISDRNRTVQITLDTRQTPVRAPTA
jgi:uncharacterized protein YaeQ